MTSHQFIFVQPEVGSFCVCDVYYCALFTYTTWLLGSSSSLLKAYNVSHVYDIVLRLPLSHVIHFLT